MPDSARIFMADSINKIIQELLIFQPASRARAREADCNPILRSIFNSTN